MCSDGSPLGVVTLHDDTQRARAQQAQHAARLLAAATRSGRRDAGGGTHARGSGLACARASRFLLATSCGWLVKARRLSREPRRRCLELWVEGRLWSFQAFVDAERPRSVSSQAKPRHCPG